MRSMITIGVFFALVLTISLVLPQPASGSSVKEDSSVVVQDESTSKLDELTKRVEKLELEKTTLDLQVKTQSALLADIYGWLRSLPSASLLLNANLDEARRDGFTKAGPNPRSKEKVLDSLQKFSLALNALNPANSTAAKKK